MGKGKAGRKGWKREKVDRKKVGREKVGTARVGERKRREREGGEGLCSSKNFFKKPESWTLANFETDRRPCSKPQTQLITGHLVSDFFCSKPGRRSGHRPGRRSGRNNGIWQKLTKTDPHYQQLLFLLAQ